MFFSGLAVIISLAGIWMVDNQALRSMALGAMIVVGIAIVAAVVLLPTLIGLLGHRVEAGGVAWRFTRFLRALDGRAAAPAGHQPARRRVDVLASVDGAGDAPAVRLDRA